VLILSACAPFPHYQTVAPAVSGRVHRSGGAAANMLVYVNTPGNNACSSDSGVVTRTDSEGRFHVELRKAFRLFVVMDPGRNWQLCIADDETRYLGWHDIGIGGPSPEIVFDCNLDRQPRVQNIGNSASEATEVCMLR
jgi:hypothetical protein